MLISNKVNIWREIIADNAGLVGNDDLDGTVELLQKWLAMSPDEQQTMQQQAKHCFKNRFYFNTTGNSLLTHFLSSNYKDTDK